MKKVIQWIAVAALVAWPFALCFAGDLPDGGLTPGAINPAITQDNIKSTICVPNYTKRAGIRKVRRSIEKQILSEYGVTDPKPGEYEVDHLISLELGGSNDVYNLWPQSYITQPHNAHGKDRLENVLHKLVCSDKITLEEAQTAIRTDWIAAFDKYVGER